MALDGYMYGDIGRYSWDEDPLSHRSVPSRTDSQCAMSCASSPGRDAMSPPLDFRRDSGRLRLKDVLQGGGGLVGARAHRYCTVFAFCICSRVRALDTLLCRRRLEY